MNGQTMDNFPFVDDGMSENEQIAAWKEEYIKLQKREERGLKLVRSLKEENDKMNETNKMGINLVNNLRKQIEKYQQNDSFNINDDDDNDIDNWKSRYLSEKRTSEYLRAECEDLQNEIEELKENNNQSNGIANNSEDQSDLLEASLAIANNAWMEEITTLLEQFKNSNANSYNLSDLKDEMQKEVNKRKEQILTPNNNKGNYKQLYEEAVQSKYELIQKTSKEIQSLRQIIYNHNRNEIYKSLFDRIVRYHNLDGNEDTLFQLIIDADLNNAK